MQDSAWGWLIVTYLFLAGAGAGAFIAAVACDLLAPDWSKELARAGALAAGPLVAVGTACLVFDLEAGFWEPWRQLYLIFNPTSMITWGVVILSGFIPVAFGYGLALNQITAVGRYLSRHLRALEIVGSVLAVATAGYTGVLIAVINGVPFWNTPLVPVLFTVSAMSTGLAVAMIGTAMIEADAIKTLTNFALGHVIFLAAEAVVLLLFVFMSPTRSVEAAESARMLISGPLSVYFWALVVVIGIAAPLVMSLAEYFHFGEMPKLLVVGADVCVLVGGLSLRALIIYSGVPPAIV